MTRPVRGGAAEPIVISGVAEGVVLPTSSSGSPASDVNAEIVNNFWMDVEQGLIPGISTVDKFGASIVIGTSYSPVTASGFYRTPTSATSLEFVSDSTDDSAAGTGAQEVTIQGLNSSWDQVTQVIETNGTTPVALPTDLIRLYRWYVSRSGTYATQTTGSHVGELTIQEAGGGDVWTKLIIDSLAFGQSQIACFTVPLGKTGYIFAYDVHVDATKPCDFAMFQRPNANDVTAPYTGTLRLVERILGLGGSADKSHIHPLGGFAGPCDIFTFAKVSTGTGSLTANFELALVDT